MAVTVCIAHSTSTMASAVICMIVSVRGCRMSPLWSHLRAYTPCLLRRQPENQFDSNAIVVLANGKEVGYVEREAAQLLSPMLEKNAVIANG